MNVVFVSAPPGWELLALQMKKGKGLSLDGICRRPIIGWEIVDDVQRSSSGHIEFRYVSPVIVGSDGWPAYSQTAILAPDGRTFTRSFDTEFKSIDAWVEFEREELAEIERKMLKAAEMGRESLLAFWGEIRLKWHDALKALVDPIYKLIEDPEDRRTLH